jgi:hypothetical protein
MARKKVRLDIDGVFFLLVLLAYLVGQVLIGTYLPKDNSLHFDAPADVDFLYYAGIIHQMKHSFPPQNPAYGGVTLSQSFIQYYPTMLVSYVVNPYLAMRIMNLVYLLLFAYLLRRYFRQGWGIALALLTAGSVGFGLINSLGIDLIARGFNHFPFFIALTIALFEKDKKWLRIVALFLLGWLHSFSGLLALLYFALYSISERFSRSSLLNAVVCLVGLGSAVAITMGVADKPFYFPFVEGFGFDLTHLWMHSIPSFLMVIAARNKKIYILFGIAFIFGLWFHYNPFFPVFMLYYAMGWATAEIVQNQSRVRIVPMALAGLMYIGLIFGASERYNPWNGSFYPHIDNNYAGAMAWLEENSDPEAVILAAPLESEWNCRLMEKRAVYLGFIPHVAHLGIDWRERGQEIVNYSRQPSVYLEEIDYFIYGPNEGKLFSDIGFKAKPIYADKNIRIWKIKQ